MSFPEYLKERIAEEYKNLFDRKFEDIKSGTENLRNAIYPAITEITESFKTQIQNEINRIQETIEAELKATHEKVTNHLETLFADQFSSWQRSDPLPAHQIDSLVTDIVSKVPEPSKKENGDLEVLGELIRKIDDGHTQSEILNILLNCVSKWVNRGVLFVVKGEQATAWTAIGLGFDGDLNRVRQIKIDLNQFHILREVVQTGEPAWGSADQFADNSQLFFMLGGGFPQSALAFPILVRGKIAGVLYADLRQDLSQAPDLPNLLYVASRCAGFAIDLLSAKAKPAVARVPAAAPASTPVPEKVAPPSIDIRSTAESISAPAEYDDSRSTVPIQVKAAAEVESEDGHSTVIMPAPFIPEKQAVVTEEDQKLHDDARRFARLLVSEIKLYNEAQVSAGRENKDLYDRLRDDIERSRRMYMDRVPEHIHSTTNYFYEELVRTLANGDPSLLGM